MQTKNKFYSIFILTIYVSLHSCSGISSNSNHSENLSKLKIENNKVKINIEQQKDKIIELEDLINELNSRIEYQENMLNTFSEEFKDQLQIVNQYDSSSSEITKTLIKMKNKFEVLEDRAFYTDSVYFEIVNDLVEIDSKIQKLSYQGQESNSINKIAISKQEYSKRYYNALNSFIHNGTLQNSLEQFEELIQIDSKHSLSDNCQYWIGEIYYKQRLFERSILEFNKVFMFKDSNKLDDAQFKIILCYINLNNSDLAINELKNLKDNFSDSEYIGKAEKFINKLTK